MTTERDCVFPEPLVTTFARQYGLLLSQTSLHGLSRNQIWRVDFSAHTIIVKQSESARETYFYRQIAPQLAACSVHVPMLLGSWVIEGTYWLALEWIPQPLDRSRWLADPAVMQLLQRLHHWQLNQSVESADLFQPQWTATMTEQALTYFPRVEHLSLIDVLEHHRAISQSLFASATWISGDPNPRNWGVRADGTVVLFDWERFGRGAPALDLAITVPGLSDWAAFQQVAARYLQCTDNVDRAVVAQLTREMVTAKVWSVVEFLSNAYRGEVADMTVIPHIVDKLPAWIDRIAKGNN